MGLQRIWGSTQRGIWRGLISRLLLKRAVWGGRFIVLEGPVELIVSDCLGTWRICGDKFEGCIEIAFTCLNSIDFEILLCVVIDQSAISPHYKAALTQ
jgi:hypothetical protein